MSSVVNVRVNNIRPRYQNLKEWTSDKNNVYIGRRGIVFINNERYPKEDSIWANPYKTKDFENIDEVLSLYEVYIRDKIKKEKLQDELLFLKGKKLGCWCSPGKCHGDILLNLLLEEEN